MNCNSGIFCKWHLLGKQMSANFNIHISNYQYTLFDQFYEFMSLLYCPWHVKMQLTYEIVYLTVYSFTCKRPITTNTKQKNLQSHCFSFTILWCILNVHTVNNCNWCVHNNFESTFPLDFRLSLKKMPLNYHNKKVNRFQNNDKQTLNCLLFKYCYYFSSVTLNSLNGINCNIIAIAQIHGYFEITFFAKIVGLIESKKIHHE